MKQVQYVLPDSWAWKTLDDVSEKITDGTHHSPKVQFSEWEPGRFKYITSKNIKNSGMKLDNIAYIDQDTHSNIYTRCPPEIDDQLLTKDGAMTGTCCLNELNEPFSLLSSVALIKQKRSIILPKYLNYYLQSQVGQNFLLGDISGAAITRTNIKKLKGTPVPLAPFSEQERIVGKLNALLTRIDTAIEHLQRKLDLSKQLFDSVLDEFFKLSDCDSVPITEVVDFIGGSQPPKSQFSDVQKEGYVRLIQIRDYKSENHIVYVDSASTKKFCTKDDVMIGRYGPPVFQILRGLNGAYNVALMKAVPNEELLTKDYLFWFLQSPSIQNYVIGISQRAAGQSGVNKKALEKYLIPVPSKAIQHDIVDKVGQLVNKSHNLEAEVTSEIMSLNQLKASILDSGFKGEL